MVGFPVAANRAPSSYLAGIGALSGPVDPDCTRRFGISTLTSLTLFSGAVALERGVKMTTLLPSQRNERG